MDIFDEELLAFWRALQKNGVRYIMVGGVATNLHGYHRTTEDIDVWLEDTLENRKKTRIAFREYGMGDLEPLERMQLLMNVITLLIKQRFMMWKCRSYISTT